MDILDIISRIKKIYSKIKNKISKKNIKIILILSAILGLYIFRRLLVTLLFISGIVGLTYLYYSDSDDTLKNE
tara:strand:- start:507 stop:725 length:219 start_codon:yes stop_codon:yes gene_type:complete